MRHAEVLSGPVCLGVKTPREASIQGQAQRAERLWEVRKRRAELPITPLCSWRQGLAAWALWVCQPGVWWCLCLHRGPLPSSSLPSHGLRGHTVLTSRKLGLREGALASPQWRPLSFPERPTVPVRTRCGATQGCHQAVGMLSSQGRWGWREVGMGARGKGPFQTKVFQQFAFS